MMKLFALSAAFVAGANAVELPSFTNNDDYDEMNLNIRLLSKSNASLATVVNKTSADVATVEVTTKLSMTTASTAKEIGDAACTEASCSTDAAKKCMNVAATSSLSMACDNGELVSFVDSARRARALSAAVEKSFDWTHKFYVPKSAAAGLETTLKSDNLVASLKTQVAAKLSSAGISAVVGNMTLGAAKVTGLGPAAGGDAGATTAAPPAAATPAASSSSDAVMMKVNLGIFAAVAMFFSM